VHNIGITLFTYGEGRYPRNDCWTFKVSETASRRQSSFLRRRSDTSSVRLRLQRVHPTRQRLSLWTTWRHHERCPEVSGATSVTPWQRPKQSLQQDQRARDPWGISGEFNFTRIWENGRWWFSRIGNGFVTCWLDFVSTTSVFASASGGR